MNYQYTSRANPIRLALVGGGPGSFAGIAHPIAARLDGRFAIVAGVFSSDPLRSKERAEIHGVVPDRAYGSIHEMIESEQQRIDGIEAIAIITPRQTHFGLARAALEAGLHVICEKPITETAEEARQLLDIADRTDLVFCLTHNYSGYPMVRHAKRMVRDGQLADIRMVEAQFTLGLSAARDESRSTRSPWKQDLSGQRSSWILLEVGTHVEHLVRYVTGLNPVEVCAEIGSASPLSQNDDTAMMLIRYENGARGIMWCTFAAAGGTHGLKLRVHGKLGGIEWRQEHPEDLVYTQVDHPMQILVRGEPGLSTDACLNERITRGHPEGFHEAFANLYRDFAEAIRSKKYGTALLPEFATYPTILDGLKTLTFCEACFKSALNGAVWTHV